MKIYLLKVECYFDEEEHYENVYSTKDKAIKEGKAADVSFKLPGAPVTSWLTLLFLFSVLVLMAFDYPNGTYTIGSIPLLAVLLVAGWFGVRKRVHEIHSTAPTLRK